MRVWPGGVASYLVIINARRLGIDEFLEPLSGFTLPLELLQSLPQPQPVGLERPWPHCTEGETGISFSSHTVWQVSLSSTASKYVSACMQGSTFAMGHVIVM